MAQNRQSIGKLDDGLIYLGDKYVSVVYTENDKIFSVVVVGNLSPPEGTPKTKGKDKPKKAKSEKKQKEKKKTKKATPLAPIMPTVQMPAAPVKPPITPTSLGTAFPTQKPKTPTASAPTAPVKMPAAPAKPPVTPTSLGTAFPSQKPKTPTGPTAPTAPVKMPAAPVKPPVTPTSLETAFPTLSAAFPTQKPKTPTGPTAPTAPTGSFTTTLDLDQVPAQYKAAFANAATRWSQVIVGDLENHTVTADERSGSKCKNLPNVIDDVYICSTVEFIDGVDGVLGAGGPEFVRVGTHTITTIGRMRFDSADVAALRADGSFLGVVLREMGHVYGIGTLWDDNKLLDANCAYKLDSFATAKYQSWSGCKTPVPVEQGGGSGTACGHWSESCFQTELMPGYASGAQQLSQLTVATLQDIGYVVDYSKADLYGPQQMDKSCICTTSAAKGQVKGAEKIEHSPLASTVTFEANRERRRRQLSAEGYSNAVEYGQAYGNGGCQHGGRVGRWSNLRG